MAEIERDVVDKAGFIKLQEDAFREVDWIVQTLDVDSRKQIGNRFLIKSGKGKWDLHEFFVAIAKKLEYLELEVEILKSDLEDATKTERKRPGRPKKMDGKNQSGKSGQEELERPLPG